MRKVRLTCRVVLFFTIFFLSVISGLTFGQKNNTVPVKYICLPFVKNGEKETSTNRYGIPFIEGMMPRQGDVAKIDVGTRVKRIFLLGMTHSGKSRAWSDPQSYSKRYFIGDELGSIQLTFADGSTQIFPMILGSSIWWGSLFYEYADPYSSDKRMQEALKSSLHLYPPAPVEDGKYIAVISPEKSLVRSITIQDSPKKVGTLEISGITIEPDGKGEIAGAAVVPTTSFSPDFMKFLKKKSLHPLGEEDEKVKLQMNDLRRVFYSEEENFRRHVTKDIPEGYSGPKVCFEGNIAAEILSNAFHYNVQDIADKVDEKGMYHTSTKDALSWGGYYGFGTYKKKLGRYYGSSFSRDMGRSLQEITMLGYTDKALRCADYSLRMARLWTTDPSLKIKDIFLPPHWSEIINKPSRGTCFENDGHGLITLFLYKLWQRLPNRDEWLRSHWVDLKASGDWISWQFDHPEISGAVNGVLHTTGESASKNGYSVYADYVCMEALLGLARMAMAIGDNQSAHSWLNRAQDMRKAIEKQYVINDAKYGPVWTLDYAGWPHKSTVLGPLIFLPDYLGFAPEDDDSKWRSFNEAAYKRLVDNYYPFGFYGQAMGYGQGFVTQSAMLLDRMQDATKMMNWTARQIHDPRFKNSYIVPEGCQIDSTGHFWYRVGDLGNGVQEAEIVKALRIMIGLDDTQPDRLRFFPRMPYGWNKIAVEKYPVLFERSGEMETAFIRYKLERSKDKMKLEITSNKALGAVAMRLGPFEKQPDESSVRVNGKNQKITVEQSGDSWWARFSMSIED